MTAANIILLSMLILILLIIGIVSYYILKQIKYFVNEYGMDEKFKNKFNLLYTDIGLEGDSTNESDK